MPEVVNYCYGLDMLDLKEKCVLLQTSSTELPVSLQSCMLLQLRSASNQFCRQLSSIAPPSAPHAFVHLLLATSAFAALY